MIIVGSSFAYSWVIANTRPGTGFEAFVQSLAICPGLWHLKHVLGPIIHVPKCFFLKVGHIDLTCLTVYFPLGDVVLVFFHGLDDAACVGLR